jgi:hypothetical protein
MHKRKKAKRALHSMRGPDGRFKAVSKSSEEGQVEKAPTKWFTSLAGGSRGAASLEQKVKFGELKFGCRCYKHINLKHVVYVWGHDIYDIPNYLR